MTSTDSTADITAAEHSSAPITAGRPRQRRSSKRRWQLSPSRAADFRWCPLLYRFRAIDRITAPLSEAALLGRLVHAVLENLFKLPPAERTLEALATLLDPAWEQVSSRSDAEKAFATLDDHQRARLRAKTHTVAAAYFQIEDPATVHVVARETWVRAELADGTPLLGVIDRLDEPTTGELEVVDYKTGRPPVPGNAEQKALFQLKFYALILWRQRGQVPARLRLLYPGANQTISLTPDLGQLERFERVITALATAIKTATATGDFRPRRSWQCRACDFRSLCPEFGGTPPPYPFPDQQPSPGTPA